MEALNAKALEAAATAQKLADAEAGVEAAKVL